MPAPILYVCTRDDVIRAFGGAKYVAQAIPDGNGEINYDQLDDARRFASGDVAAHCGNSFLVWNQAAEFPQFIVQLATVLAVRWCWWIGTQGKAVPEPVQQEYEKTLARLEKIEQGKIGLGAEPNPPARVGRYPIDNSDCGRRAVYGTWRRAGFLGRR